MTTTTLSPRAEKAKQDISTTIAFDEKDVPSSSSATESVHSRSTDEDVDGDYGSRADHVFSNPQIAKYWTDVYDQALYEGRHRFDPDFTWSAKEEKQLRWKIDKRVMVWCWFMFAALELNRRNINRAITDGLLKDLGMNTNDFNTGQTIFLVSFLAAELPSGLISKRLGADNWIPFLIIAWSVVSAAQAGLTNKAGYFACRAVLGLLMGGFIPDIVLYITYWYKKRELPIRLSWFWTVLSVCNIIGSLLAAGLLEMRGLAGLQGWKWLFIIEGALTSIVGFLSYVLMPASPSQTAGRGRGNGWFTEHEEKILVNRLLRDDPSKGDMHNRQAVTLVLLWKCLKDYDLWPLYLVGLTSFIPAAPPQNYLAFILRSMGFSPFHANLLTIPSQFAYGVQLVLVTALSEKFNERAMFASLSNWWFFPFLVALVALGRSPSNWLRYGLLTGLLSYPYQHAIQVAWNSRNSNSVRARAVSACLYNMFVQSGGIIASNIYRENDRPYYLRGNKILLVINIFNLALYVLVKVYYVARNKRREAVWSKMTGQEQVEYVNQTKDEGTKRLDFRFAH